MINAAGCWRLFQRIGLSGWLGQELNDRGEPAASVVAEAERRVRQCRVPLDLRRAIRRAVRRLERSAGRSLRLALRSSAVGEDGERSFAGLHRTALGVPVAQVIDEYRRVVASLFGPAAVAYRREHGEGWQQASMAVGCLRMVDARSSGVAYTVDPADPQRDVMVVSAAPGLGKLVVEGQAGVDRFVLARRPPHPVLERRVQRKEKMYAVDAQGGIGLVPVPAARQAVPAVSDRVLAELAQVALRIERYMKSAQDIEWAEDGSGRLVILQVRPLEVVSDTVRIGRQAQAATKRHRVLLSGRGTIACRGIGYGQAVVVRGDETPGELPPDFVLVARVSSPHLAALVPQASAVITDVGAATGHLATITRECRVPAIMDTEIATQVLAHGPEITVDAEEGVVYEGRVDELLRYQVLRRSSTEEWREFRSACPETLKVNPMTKVVKVCIVDDEQIVCERLQPVLEKNGFVVESFTSSRAAMERLAEEAFHILITDLKMAHPDGIELLRYARRQLPEIHVVVITGFATEETAREALQRGAVEFIAKPFRLSYLRDVVLRIAEQIRQEAEAREE